MSDLIKRMAAAADRLGLSDEGSSRGSGDKPIDVAKWDSEVDGVLEFTDEYRRHESGYYFEDTEHFGAVFVSQQMVDKYSLDHTPIDKWYEEQVEYEDDEEQLKYLEEMKCNWAQVIIIDHCTGYSTTSDRSHSGYHSMTPHGHIGDQEFVAWWCDFPVELLNESSVDVCVASWADG